MEHNQRLIHLSQEHASALKLAMAVRMLAPENESDLPAVARRVREVFENELLPHFADEERFVMPRLAQIGRHDLIERMRAEHVELQKLVEALATPRAEDIHRFSAALTAHVGFEENIVWEVLEPGPGATFEAEST